MRNLWFFLLVGLSTDFISEKLFVSSETVSYTDDLYIEGLTSGASPVDDEGGDDEDGSGSGSGYSALTDLNDEEEQPRRVNFPDTFLLENILPLRPQPATDSPQNPPTTSARQQNPAPSTEDTKPALPSDRHEDDKMPGVNRAGDHIIPVETTELSNHLPEVKVNEEVVTMTWENEVYAEGGRRGKMHEANSAEEVYSENLWERTDVLAAVIACGVVGFLCAVSLLLLLAYRMKKKDEGSYDLGDTKLSATAYHKAPTKEFYA